VEPTLDLGSNTYGVALQHDVDDFSYKSHHLTGKLKVSECMIVEAMRHFDATHTMVAECCWRATMAHDSLGGEFSIADFQTLKEAVVVMRSDYQHLLMDRDYLLAIGEMYHGVLEEKENEVEQIREELSQISPSSILEDDQSYVSALSQEDISDMDGLMEKHSDLQAIVGRDDPETREGAHVLQGPLFLESPLMAQVLTPDQIVEHAFMDCGDRYTSDEDTSIWDPGLVDTHDEDTLYRIQGQLILMDRLIQ
jgi:hypothetical protein